MKLAALGAITAAIGVGLGLPGLIGIGVLWVLIGPVMRQHGKRLQEAQKASPDGKPPIDGRTFAYGTLLWALLGAPSLAVGFGQLGIDADHANWRLLPLGIGALAAGIGGLGAVLYLLGSGVQAVGDKLDGAAGATTPATLRIRSVHETGTFVNERPRMEFVFDVEPDAGSGMGTYEATKKATVPYTALAYLRIGDGFKALVAGPEDPTAMEIHWDQPVPAKP